MTVVKLASHQMCFTLTFPTLCFPSNSLSPELLSHWVLLCEERYEEKSALPRRV